MISTEQIATLARMFHARDLVVARQRKDTNALVKLDHGDLGACSAKVRETYLLQARSILELVDTVFDLVPKTDGARATETEEKKQMRIFFKVFCEALESTTVATINGQPVEEWLAFGQEMLTRFPAPAEPESEVADDVSESTVNNGN